MSLVPYTPTAAEQWVIDDAGLVFSGSGTTEQNTNSALVTTLYDQAASNEQVFEDPLIQNPSWSFGGNSSSGGSTSPGSVVLEKILSGTDNISGTCDNGTYENGTYRVEIDYSITNGSSGDWAFYIDDFSENVFFPNGSGTLTVSNYKVGSVANGKLVVRSYNSAAAGSTITITGNKDLIV
ncbi:MAG: hypothetical protein EBT51_09140 [Flavobacteriaceae bacterium]|nr:hypothetical protein [Flavobacteriaceae bacterium]